jgi:uncharacterized protein with GYD domain
MAKYMIQAAYTAGGLKGLMKDKASGRKAAVTKAVEAAGGKMEAIYYSFGKADVVLIVDLPDNSTAAAFALTASATGLVRCTTTPLLTIEEADRALTKKVAYKAPGK